MKINTACGLTASYILTILTDLECDQHHFYAMLLEGKIICVNSVDDGRMLSLRTFLEAADTFQRNDRFTIGLTQVDIVLESNTEFNASIIECICTEELRHHCYINLYTDKPIRLAYAAEISEEDMTEINKLIYSTNTEIMNNMQLQYDILKGLPFIKP